MRTVEIQQLMVMLVVAEELLFMQQQFLYLWPVLLQMVEFVRM